MHPRQRQRKAADRVIDMPLAAQHQRIEDCIDSVPERCQARTQDVPLVLLDRGRTHQSAYTLRSEGLQQC